MSSSSHGCDVLKADLTFVLTSLIFYARAVFGILLIWENSEMGMHDCKSSSRSSGSNCPCNLRGVWGGGAFDTGRFPSRLFPILPSKLEVSL